MRYWCRGNIRVFQTWVAVRFPHTAPIYGGLAHLGEHLPCMQKVIGSSPISSTNSFNLRVKIRFDLVVNRTIPSDLGDIGI